MLLNSEELLALVNGDVEPDRLADLLDRLEHCSDSADALQVLVTLRAHREEALSALHDAQELEVVASVTPHPATLPQQPNMSWASQGLRLAATVAIVAVISVWAASSYLGLGQSIDASRLAVAGYSEALTTVLPGAPPDGVQLTSDSLQDRISKAYSALDAEDFREAIRLLEGQPNDAEGRASLYLGIGYYFTERYEEALAKFIEVRNSPTVNLPGTLHEAVWYEANALLKLDRPTLALGALEAVKSAQGFPRQPDALETYWTLRESMGMTGPNQD